MRCRAGDVRQSVGSDGRPQEPLARLFAVTEQRSWFVFAAVRRVGLGVAVAAALVTAGCAAGQQASTANEQPTLDGVDGSVGPINLRGLQVETPTGNLVAYPVGSDVAIRLVIVNNGQQTDRLVSITSPAISDWGAFASTAAAGQVVAADSATPTPTHSPKATPTSTPTHSPTPTPTPGSPSAPKTKTTSPATPTTKSLPTPSRSVSISPGSRRGWGTPESTGELLLINTTQVLHPGTTIRLTFTFERAGSVTLAAPVALLFGANTAVIPTPAGGTSLEG